MYNSSAQLNDSRDRRQQRDPVRTSARFLHEHKLPHFHLHKIA